MTIADCGCKTTDTIPVTLWNHDYRLCPICAEVRKEAMEKYREYAALEKLLETVKHENA